MIFAEKELDVSTYFTNCKARKKAVGLVRVYPAKILNTISLSVLLFQTPAHLSILKLKKSTLLADNIDWKKSVRWALYVVL